KGSLRAAISAANAGRNGTYRIQLPPGEYRLTRCGADDQNARGDLDLTTAAAVTIVAKAPNVVIRQTCAGERVLDARGSGLLTLSGVSITGGSVTSSDPAVPARGGGVRARGDVKLENATIAENSVTGAEGRSAPAGQTPVAGGNAYGGGLFVEGSLTAMGSTLRANAANGGAGTPAGAPDGIASGGGSAEGGGAYVGGAIQIEGGSLAENRATAGGGGLGPTNPGGGGSARGGGIAQRASITLPNTLANLTLSANRAQGGVSGGGPGTLFPSGSPPPAGDATGGAIAGSGALSASHVTASQNMTSGGSTGLGGCATAGYCASAARPGLGRGGTFAIDADITIADSTFSANQAASGDGFFTCVTQLCSPQGVVAAPGEGGAVWTGGSLTLRDSTFTDNKASQGSGLPTLEGAARGGAAASAAALVVERATFSGNASTSGQGGAISGTEVRVSEATFTNNSASFRGGAIQATTLTANRVTASQNKAGGSGGGAVAVIGDATITNSRVLANSVDSWSGNARGGGVLAGGQLTLRDTHLSGNDGRSSRRLGFFGTFPGLFAGGGAHGASVSAERVTFTRNEAIGVSSAGGSPVIPAGVTGGAGVAATGSVSLINVTLSENRVNQPPPESTPQGLIPNVGAAVLAATLSLDHATVADNTGAASLHVAQLTTHRSVVVAGDGQNACADAAAVSSATYNHFSDASCALSGAGNQQTTADFLLGPVTDNGGSVPTRRPAYASVLIDQVPPAACPVPTDARGVSRPQGAACDIGAFEAEPLAGTGNADFAVSFINPPASVTPGGDGVWQLRVQNQGPSPAAPAVRIDVPAGVQLTTASATAQGACTTSSPAYCVWSAALAPGAAATMTLIAHVDPAVSAPLVWRAEVFATGLQPPFEDDVTDLSTSLAPKTGIGMSVGFSRYWDNPGNAFSAVRVELRNAGPSNAIGTPSQPIEVVFHPAPGVRALTAPTPVIGSFAPSDMPFAAFEIAVTVDGPVPAQLGSVELKPGANVQPGVPQVPVFAADLELRAFREPGAQQPGARTNYRFEVLNRGPATARDVTFFITGNSEFTNTWSPSMGTVTGDPISPTWTIAALEPGQSATLSNSVAPSSEFGVVSARVEGRTMDLNPENDEATLQLGLALQGTADLQLSSLQAYAGSAENQRILRATVINAGPAAAGATPERRIVVELRTSTTARPVGARAITPGWTCTLEPYYAYCWAEEPLAVGGTASVEFVVEGTFPDTFPRLGATVSGDITPDPDPNNNTRYANAAVGL
ncbi:MAG TPA: choice-of-anchor Q domain-containing protein, partial [Polyangiaceae bacterium]|nr:choice-of-anchor Q domain-containing protein [Polyangiaceae bacterium]